MCDRISSQNAPLSNAVDAADIDTISINAGSSASGSFVADTYYSGGSIYSTNNTIDMSLITGTVPPASVFQTERYGEFTYTIPDLVVGSAQTVTLYFQESFWSAAGQRTFNVSINGSTVLSAFDIFAAAGGPNRAIARTFSTTANSNGQVVIQFTRNGPDQPKICGITVTSEDSSSTSYILTIATSGNGSTNPAAGSYRYAAGTAVQVNAMPGSGATFTGWSGAATGTANPITITMDGDKTLTATFTGTLPDTGVTPSNGCGVADGPAVLTAGGRSVPRGLATSTRLSIMSNGQNRDFIVDIPEDYDPNHPYRLIFSWHQAYGSAEGNANGQHPAFDGPNFNAENYAYFGLKRAARMVGDSAIFVAPDGIGNFPWDYNRDVVLFDNLLERISENLCVDKSRVFTTGFSFGAMMSHALSLGRADKLRGAVTMAPANFNFTQPTNSADAVAYFSITGMSDGTCRWVNSDANRTGGKYCSITHAEENGCTVPNYLPTASRGSNNHVCYDYEGCNEGYPVKVCTFDGAHTPSSVSDGSPGDDGLRAFVPPLAWEFISQL